MGWDNSTLGDLGTAPVPPPVPQRVPPHSTPWRSGASDGSGDLIAARMHQLQAVSDGMQARAEAAEAWAFDVRQLEGALQGALAREATGRAGLGLCEGYGQMPPRQGVRTAG